MQKETKIRIASNDGDVILDDFVDSNCCQCIINNCSNKESSFVVCPKNGLVKKRLFYKRNSLGAVFICDDKEKNKNNFIQMAELVFHNQKCMIDIQHKIQSQEIERIDTEITVFKHNVETINGESIGEFEAAVSTKKLRNSYKEIVKVVEESIDSRDSSMATFIARQALNNQRIQTELFVSRIIGNRYDSKSTLSNPWDAVMTNVYLLYPLAQKKHLEIIMGPYREKFQIDYNATKVASYYILDNAIKYSLEHTKIQISFKDDTENLDISFQMTSPVINDNEVDLIFEKGIRGENAKLLNAQGSGYGLYCAKKLLCLSRSQIMAIPGEYITRRNGIEYANNVFRIRMKKTLSQWK
ncbi:MAG: hypothetical protein KBT27_15625 [Prevotellaceae bacterium]|nr:hypothetical protein [Candidatus Faecinaster equi]